MKSLKIAVAGTGYVGLSMATLLAQHNEVVAVDIVPEKVDMINHRVSPIQDEYIEKYFATKQLNLVATLDAESAYRDADFVIIAASRAPSPWAIAVASMSSMPACSRSAAITPHASYASCSRPSSYARAKHSMTTYTPRVSSWAIPR